MYLKKGSSSIQKSLFEYIWVYQHWIELFVRLNYRFLLLLIIITSLYLSWQITACIVKFQTREPFAIINEHAKVIRGITVTRLRIKKFQQGGKCIAFAKYAPHSYISMSPAASSTFISKVAKYYNWPHDRVKILVEERVKNKRLGINRFLELKYFKILKKK